MKPGESFSGRRAPGKFPPPSTSSLTSAASTRADQTAQTFCPLLRLFCALHQLSSAAATEFQLWTLESIAALAGLSSGKQHWSSAWSLHQFRERCFSLPFWSNQWILGTVVSAATLSGEFDPFGVFGHSSRFPASWSIFLSAYCRLTVSGQLVWCVAAFQLLSSCRSWSLPLGSRSLLPCHEARCHAARERRQSSPHGAAAYLQATQL